MGRDSLNKPKKGLNQDDMRTYRYLMTDKEYRNLSLVELNRYRDLDNIYHGRTENKY